VKDNQSLLIIEYIFLLKVKLAMNPIVPVISENDTDIKNMDKKYITPEENLDICNCVKK
jgi:hypothetical protein